MPHLRFKGTGCEDWNFEQKNHADRINFSWCVGRVLVPCCESFDRSLTPFAMISFTLKATFDTTADALYSAWLNSDIHSAMTGGAATCSDEEGGRFTAWDDYIHGRNIRLTPGVEIVQSWRTEDFEDDDPDSELTLRFEDTDDGCLMTLIHRNIPDDQTDYEEGWQEHYLEPMEEYFNSRE